MQNTSFRGGSRTRLRGGYVSGHDDFGPNTCTDAVRLARQTRHQSIFFTNETKRAGNTAMKPREKQELLE